MRPSLSPNDEHRLLCARGRPPEGEENVPPMARRKWIPGGALGPSPTPATVVPTQRQDTDDLLDREFLIDQTTCEENVLRKRLLV